MSESCADCRFSTPAQGRLPDTLECRRRPPTGGARRILAEWPLTSLDAWCGEYEQRPVAVTKTPRAKRPAVNEPETREQG